MKINNKLKNISNIIKLESSLLSLSISYFISSWIIYFDNEKARILGYFIFVISIFLIYTALKNIFVRFNQERIRNILIYCLLFGLIGVYSLLSYIYYINLYYKEYIHGDSNVNYIFVGWKSNVFTIKYIIPLAIFISYVSQTIFLYKSQVSDLIKSLIMVLKDFIVLFFVISMITIVSLGLVLFIFALFNLGYPG